MTKTWSQLRDEWSKTTSLPEPISQWAIESISQKEREIYAYEEALKNEVLSEAENKLRSLKSAIKKEITSKENSLDDLTLNTPNSSKLQVSVPSSLNYLMKAWAAAEGRDLSSIALQCLEIGLRALKSKGSIPESAVERYEIACQRRIALAEVNKTWEKHELISKKILVS